MIRTFNILDRENKHKYIGTLRYNTDNKQFSLILANSYEKKNPDLFMKRCIQLGYKEMPQWMVDLWIKQRLCPPNVCDIADILKMAGLEEYDEMGLFDFNHGICAMDPYYFEEVGGLLEYRKTHDKYWSEYEKYISKFPR